MNRNLFVDAISCLNLSLIEDYILMRKRLKANKIIKKQLKILGLSTIAACFIMFLLSITVLAGVFYYINAEKYDSASATKCVTQALYLSLIIVATLGFIVWRTGSKHIKKKYSNCDII